MKIFLSIILALALVSILIVGGLAFSKFIPINKSLAKAMNTETFNEGPPHFLYSLSGGDQDVVDAKEIAQKDGPSRFKAPLAITTSPEREIFVADTGHSQIQVFNETDQWIMSFGKGKMVTPSGLAYANQKLYIADPNAKKIFAYGEDGKELPVFLDNQKLLFADGTEGQIIRPTGIQVGPDQLFYVTDIANQCVIVLDAQGKILKSFGSPGTADGQFQFPNALFVSKDGKIYVSDSNNGRLQIFNQEGKFLTKINGVNGKNGALSLPRGISVTEEGLIYVVDVFSNTVRVFDEVGVELWTLGGTGNKDGQFSFPNGLWIDSTGHIYITDRENNRIQVFGYE